MRKWYAIIPVIVLNACNGPASESADSSNPAHCIARFHYAAFAFNKAGQREKATPMVARAIYEMEKVRAAGTSEADAQAESIALTKAYANNHEAMMDLIRACGTAQDSDPKYRAEIPQLFAQATSVTGIGQ
jgi:hypothetical protein